MIEHLESEGEPLTEQEFYDDPDYQRWLAECAKECRCTDGPCGGVTADGVCDEIVREPYEYGRFDDDDEDESFAWVLPLDPGE